MPAQRFDTGKLKAQKTDEGYIQDSPVISRTGIFEYLNFDGSIRRELRLPEDVFNEDSLNSLKGKPITKKHHGIISAKNVSALSIGTVLSEGRRADGDLLQTDIIIHNPNDLEDWRELSLGYTTDLEEIPGEWQGQKYDAIQRNIRYNHLSVVKKGRAGSIARLNLDGSEEIINDLEITKMPKIRLDTGLEYEAPAEVVAAVEKLRADNAVLAEKSTKDISAKQAEIDSLKNKFDELEKSIPQIKQDVKAEIEQRVKLEATAKEFKVDCKDMDNKAIKVAIIKTTDAKFDAADKNEHYIDARFDMVLQSREDEAAQKQRKTGVNMDDKTSTTVAKSSLSRYDEYMASLANKTAKE